MIDIKPLFYDLETLPACFTCSVLKNDEWFIFECSVRKNDIKSLLSFIASSIKEDFYFVGFNSKSFDDILLNFILQNEQYLEEYDGEKIADLLSDFAQFIIDFQRNRKKDFSVIQYERRNSLFKYKFSVPFKSIDLMEVIREGYNIKGLKLVGVNLKHPVLQDIPFDHTHRVDISEIDDVIEYNKNDVIITKSIFNYIEDRLQLRLDLEKVYNVDLISAADSTIAKVIFDSYYTTKPEKRFTSRPVIKMSDIVSDKIKFKTEPYKSFLNELMSVTFYDESTKGFARTFNSLICTHKIAAGGIHGAIKNTYLHSTNEYLLLDYDFGLK